MMDYERWFCERTSRFEKLIIKGAVLLLLLLFVSQALLTQPALRRILSLSDRNEGNPVSSVENNQAVPVSARPLRTGYVELSIVNETVEEDIDVKVNGQVVAALGRMPIVKVTVQDGDFLEIDGPVPKKDILIKVTSVSDGMLAPVFGKTVIYYGQPETIAYVTIEAQ